MEFGQIVVDHRRVAARVGLLEIVLEHGHSAFVQPSGGIVESQLEIIVRTDSHARDEDRPLTWLQVDQFVQHPRVERIACEFRLDDLPSFLAMRCVPGRSRNAWRWTA